MLKTILAGKRIVAMGEATHGTSEFFRMKHRLTEFLVVEMGFRHFGMELSSADGRLLDDYIQGKHADPLQVLYWPWRTREVLDMLAWMRAYNAGGGPQERLTFHGIDPIYSARSVMAQNVTRLLKEAGPESKIAVGAQRPYFEQQRWMGSYLKAEWGDVAYHWANLTTAHSPRAWRQSTHIRLAPLPDSMHMPCSAGRSLLYLDFKALSRSPALRSWLELHKVQMNFQELHASTG